MTPEDEARARARILDAFGLTEEDLAALDPNGSYAAARAAYDAENAAMIDRAMAMVWESRPVACAHVVHPAEKARGGWAVCANCFAPVWLG